jgi:hypothetical protein
MLDSKVYQDLLEVQKKSANVDCWAIKDNDIVKVPLTIKTIQLDYKRIVFKFNPYHIHYFNKVINGSRKMDFVIDSKSLLFTCDFKEINKEEHELTVSIPSFHHYADRRTDDRIIPNINISIAFEGTKIPFKANVYDLSRGGLSIILGREQNALLKEGNEFDCELNFGKTYFKTRVVVRNILPFKPYEFDGIPFQGKRYSLVFQNPSAALILRIDNMIKEQFLDNKSAYSH